MKKIFELTGDDFIKGYSTQPGMATNGVFQSAPGFDPFNEMGYIKPSLAATALTAPATNPVKFINSFNVSGTGYFYAQSTTKLYQYLVDSPYTQADKTAEINTDFPIAGAIVWGDPTTGLQKYIYAQCNTGVKVYADPIPVEGGASVEILSSVTTSSATDIRPMCVGADKNLYIGTTDAVSQIIRTDQVSGNTHNAFLTDVGFTVRGIVNDGRYLIVLADNNAIATTSRTVGNYRCRIYFWDMVGSLSDVIWDIQDSYLIGGVFKDNKIYVFGYNGIYVCNSVTSPKMIWDFRGNSSITKRPASPYQITQGSNEIYWADGATNGNNIYAIRGTTIYSPFITHSSTYAHSAISAIGSSLVAAHSQPGIVLHNVGSTAGNLTALTAKTNLPQTYTYGYTKVVLKSPLSTGQEINLILYNGNSSLISNTTSKTYAVDGAKRVLTFRPTPTSASVKSFDDIYVSINSVAGAAIEKVCVYGMPTDDIQE